jgi:hypothetical protein
MPNHLIKSQHSGRSKHLPCLARTRIEFHLKISKVLPKQLALIPKTALVRRLALAQKRDPALRRGQKPVLRPDLDQKPDPVAWKMVRTEAPARATAAVVAVAAAEAAEAMEAAANNRD